MGTLYVIQTGRTTWEDEQRLDSAAGAPLTDEGARNVERVARELTNHGLSAVFASEGEAETQTAWLVGQALSLKVHKHNGIREFDYGLWQGLTVEEIKRRQPKVFRQWTEAPASVRPPGGETLEEAQQRLREAVRSIIKRHRNDPVLLVLRPILLGLLRCMLAGENAQGLWRHVDPSFTWASYDMDEETL